MATWTIDPLHSDITFKVRHLMISTVKGFFADFTATVEGDETNAFEGAKVNFEAAIDSINTGNTDRDNHLKSADFFDAENHPKLTFTSTSFTKKSDGEYSLTGDLTIRGTSLPITLSVEHHGTMVDFYGNTKAGFQATGTINRKAYGLAWSAVTEAGGVVVSDEIKLELDIQLSKVVAEAEATA